MRGIDFTLGKVCNWDPRLWLVEVIEPDFGLDGPALSVSPAWAARIGGQVEAATRVSHEVLGRGAQVAGFID